MADINKIREENELMLDVHDLKVTFKSNRKEAVRGIDFVMKPGQRVGLVGESGSGREFGGSDTYATSQIISAGLVHLGIDDDDIIICGRQAIAGDTAQVGPQIAEKLGIPQISYAGEIKKDGHRDPVTAVLPRNDRETETARAGSERSGMHTCGDRGRFLGREYIDDRAAVRHRRRDGVLHTEYIRKARD